MSNQTKLQNSAHDPILTRLFKKPPHPAFDTDNFTVEIPPTGSSDTLIGVRDDRRKNVSHYFYHLSEVLVFIAEEKIKEASQNGLCLDGLSLIDYYLTEDEKASVLASFPDPARSEYISNLYPKTPQGQLEREIRSAICSHLKYGKALPAQTQTRKVA